MRERTPCAGCGDVGDDWVGAHGESADGLGVDVVGFKQIENGVACEAAAFGVQRGGAAVDVVVAGAAGGELELAEAKAGAGEKREKLLCVGGRCHQEDCRSCRPGFAVHAAASCGVEGSLGAWGIVPRGTIVLASTPVLGVAENSGVCECTERRFRGLKAPAPSGIHFLDGKSARRAIS